MQNCAGTLYCSSIRLRGLGVRPRFAPTVEIFHRINFLIESMEGIGGRVDGEVNTRKISAARVAADSVLNTNDNKSLLSWESYRARHEH